MSYSALGIWLQLLRHPSPFFGGVWAYIVTGVVITVDILIFVRLVIVALVFIISIAVDMKSFFVVSVFFLLVIAVAALVFGVTEL